MFDEVFKIMARCGADFQEAVADGFGASIVSEVLDPIRSEIGSLCSFREEFQSQSLNIDQILTEARSLNFDKGYDR